KPPVETTSAYTITALDIFGRRGPESAPIEVFFPDFTALDPPATIESRTADGKAFLVWEAKPNKYRRGWRVVRALQPGAAGEPVTTQSLNVEFPDTQPALPPNIDSIDGTGGQVTVKFTASGHDAAQLFVLRSLTFKDTGAVVNLDPLPASARTFTDSNVEAGTLYFY